MSATAIEIKERPILFSGLMVRAILDNRKTVTRRVMKPQLTENGVRHHKWEVPDVIALCPYGGVGDRLWVRETWANLSDLRTKDPGPGALISGCFYRADYPAGLNHDDNPAEDLKWRPSIFMRRELSRLTLEITDIKVGRVQEISQADALAEGFDQSTCAAVFDHAAKGTDIEFCRWVENEETGESEADCANYCPDCAQKAAKRLGKEWSVQGWDNAEESDGPAMCDKCYKPLLVSLTTHGVERELRMEDDPDGKEPQYFPVRGADARIVHTIADGIGDLQDEHLGRLAQIGFATGWNHLNAKRGYSWDSNPWVWRIEFKRVDHSTSATARDAGTTT